MEDRIDLENQFIQEHQQDDLNKLLLRQNQWEDLDIHLMVNTIESRNRIRKKLPTWYQQISLRYPDRLCTEQCSSEETALFKASIVKELGVHRIADLTGGLGVDTWAFSQVATEVLHNEMKPWLSEAVQNNLAILKNSPDHTPSANLHFSQFEITPDNISTVLQDFRPDLVFMDPARRDDAGKKVFLIEDCRPDVLKLKEQIFKQCEFLFLKLSPMADITMAVERLGNVRDVYVISAEGECKELLLLLQKDWTCSYRLHIKEGPAEISLPQEQESQSSIHLFENIELLDSQIGSILFEPGKSLTKAGLFNTVCEHFGLYKLGRSTHLYLDSSQDVTESNHSYTHFGKCFRIIEILESGNKTVKYLAKKYPKAEVTAKNLPISSDALRKKLHCSSGGKIHIFAIKADTPTGSAHRFLVTERL